MATETFATRLRETRSSAGLSQDDLAIKLGTKQPAIAAWECGRRAPTTESVRRLAEILGVEPGWLAYGQPKTEKIGPSK